MFKSPFNFAGRIGRSEYGISFAIYFVFYFSFMLMDENSAYAIPALLVLIPMLWFIYAQGAKRCHDIGKSGWWQLIPFYFFVLISRPGDFRENEYGESPREDERLIGKVE